MSKAEKFISEHTRKCSNQYDLPEYFENGIERLKEYQPWLTPDQARRAVEIAREETIKEVCEWLYNHNDYICGSTNGIVRYDMDKLIDDLKKYLEDKK